MKICLVVSGNIPILPEGQRGWGAVEKIMDEYRKSLQSFGHQVDIKYLNDIKIGEYDIVHIHVANLCIEAAHRGLPYIYSTHDHSSYHAGKNSYNYRQQLEAIKGSIISFTHAEYVVDYFDETDKLFFLIHGVNTNYFKPSEAKPESHKLLMIANNGLMGDSGFDRKGFRYGIEAARRLGLPITVAGADGTREFFQIHKDLLSYEGLTLIDNNPSEFEILKLYQEHSIFVHPSMLEYGEPCLTLLEAASCALPAVATYRGSKDIPGLFRIERPTTEAVLDGVVLAMEDYDKTREQMLNVRLNYDWNGVCRTLEKFYEFVIKIKEDYSPERTRELYTRAYIETIKRC